MPTDRGFPGLQGPFALGREFTVKRNRRKKPREPRGGREWCCGPGGGVKLTKVKTRTKTGSESWVPWLFPGGTGQWFFFRLPRRFFPAGAAAKGEKKALSRGKAFEEWLFNGGGGGGTALGPVRGGQQIWGAANAWSFDSFCKRAMGKLRATPPGSLKPTRKACSGWDQGFRPGVFTRCSPGRYSRRVFFLPPLGKKKQHIFGASNFGTNVGNDPVVFAIET